ncbi:MAG: hypothetical protein AAFX50_23195, partial [Acidobacteriota bacterium]
MPQLVDAAFKALRAREQPLQRELGGVRVEQLGASSASWAGLGGGEGKVAVRVGGQVHVLHNTEAAGDRFTFQRILGRSLTDAEKSWLQGKGYDQFLKGAGFGEWRENVTNAYLLFQGILDVVDPVVGALNARPGTRASRIRVATADGSLLPPGVTKRTLSLTDDGKVRMVTYDNKSTRVDVMDLPPGQHIGLQKGSEITVELDNRPLTARRPASSGGVSPVRVVSVNGRQMSPEDALRLQQEAGVARLNDDISKLGAPARSQNGPRLVTGEEARAWRPSTATPRPTPGASAEVQRPIGQQSRDFIVSLQNNLATRGFLGAGGFKPGVFDASTQRALTSFQGALKRWQPDVYGGVKFDANYLDPSTREALGKAPPLFAPGLQGEPVRNLQ